MIELSLASPMFQKLGPGARELLGVIAFFPQGVDEEKMGWLFPTISSGPDMFDTFCILSLTYRSYGFTTMLAPLRDYLRPKDPTLSPLLGTTKECYLARLLADVHPAKPGFEESRWITSEDANVEYLLDVFTSIDADSENVWDACAGFMNHLSWHKPRLFMLGPKIEALPDDHPSKAQCLWNLSWLFHSVGNWAERKRLLTHTLKIWRAQRDDQRVAETTCYLSDANRQMNLPKEGIQQAEEASNIFERLGDPVNQARCLIYLARSLCDDEQLGAAEKAASHAIALLPEEGERFLVCQGHHILGEIYRSKGNMEKAIYHFEVALGISSSLNWHIPLFWIHFSLAQLFSEEGRLDDAHAHVEHAKSHAVNNPYNLARASLLQARFWYRRHMFEEAESEALRALDVFEKLGVTDDAECTRELLGKMNLDLVTHDESAGNGELPEIVILFVCINSSCLD